jgi:hypothetical protein
MTTIPHLGALVHLVTRDDPFADREDPLTAKSCRAAWATEVGSDPAALSLFVLDPAAGPRMVGLARFDEVGPPKIEAGPSGRPIGSWHSPGEC